MDHQGSQMATVLITHLPSIPVAVLTLLESSPKSIIAFKSLSLKLLLEQSNQTVSPFSSTSALMPLVSSQLSSPFWKFCWMITSSVIPFSSTILYCPMRGPPSSKILGPLHRLLLWCASHGIVITCRCVCLCPLGTMMNYDLLILSTQVLAKCLVQSKCPINIWWKKKKTFCRGFLAITPAYTGKSWKPCSWPCTAGPRGILCLQRRLGNLSLPLLQDWLWLWSYCKKKKKDPFNAGQVSKQTCPAISNPWNKFQGCEKPVTRGLRLGGLATGKLL